MKLAILWLCVAIASAIFGVILYSIATFRGSPGAERAAFRRTPVLEVLWALIPIAILIGAAWPAMKLVRGSVVAVAAYE